MATTLTPIASAPALNRASATWRVDAWFLLGCTFIAVVLLGYHPFAEDGGIYAAALASKLDGTLFPAERGFAVAHTAQSFFIPLLAGATRLSYLGQDRAVGLCFVLSVAATLFAAWALACSLFMQTSTRRWSVLLCTVAMGMPVAGTSLYLADPYLSARSISTPLLLWSLAFLLQRRALPMALCLLAAAAIHPLMAAWAGLFFLCVFLQHRSRPMVHTVACLMLALAIMAAIAAFSPDASPAVREASLSRGYWFLSAWQPYEYAGVIGPALLFVLFAKRAVPGAVRDTSTAAVAVIISVSTASLLLVHASNTSFLLARLQPMRVMHTVSLVFVLLMGGAVAEWLSGPRLRRLVPAASVAAAATGCLLLQRSTYPASGQWEWPGLPAQNGYVRAFQWAGAHSPVDAVFALDAAYTTAAGEDAQMFRAVAHRSALPDAAKDGGISSVVPSLADAWWAASHAQQGLAMLQDAEIVSRVKPLGATWIVLPAGSRTAFDCPFRNEAAAVCRLP